MGERRRADRGPEARPARLSGGARTLWAFLGVAVLAFAAGRLSAAPDSRIPPITPITPTRHASGPGTVTPVPIQASPGDPRELIPLPGPGGPGQPTPQPGLPGQAPEGGTCPLYFFQDGQFYQLQPGGPGGPGGPGPFGGSPELFPLEPVPADPRGTPLPAPAPEPPPEPPPLFVQPGLVLFDPRMTRIGP